MYKRNRKINDCRWFDWRLNKNMISDEREIALMYVRFVVGEQSITVRKQMRVYENIIKNTETYVTKRPPI